MTAPDPQTVRPGPIGAVPIGATPPFDAVIFDMDGVVTDTASLHAAAWKELFDGVLADPRAAAQGRLEPFDADLDYRRYVDGRAREDGVAGFLAARRVTASRDAGRSAGCLDGVEAGQPQERAVPDPAFGTRCSRL